MIPDVICPLCKKVIGGVEGIPDVPVRFYCQGCHREVTIAPRQSREPIVFKALDKPKVLVV